MSYGMSHFSHVTTVNSQNSSPFLCWPILFTIGMFVKTKKVKTFFFFLWSNFNHLLEKKSQIQTPLCFHNFFLSILVVFICEIKKKCVNSIKRPLNKVCKNPLCSTKMVVKKFYSNIAILMFFKIYQIIHILEQVYIMAED